MNTLLHILFGIFVGALVMMTVVKLASQPETKCVTGRVELATDSVAIIIGEAVVCGEFHSNIYGPTVAAWEGDILFYHDHEGE